MDITEKMKCLLEHIQQLIWSFYYQQRVLSEFTETTQLRKYFINKSEPLIIIYWVTNERIETPYTAYPVLLQVGKLRLHGHCYLSHHITMKYIKQIEIQHIQISEKQFEEKLCTQAVLNYNLKYHPPLKR